MSNRIKTENKNSTPAPTFNDLLDHAEAGPLKRGLNRYFYTRNPEKSIARHKKIGTPIIKNAIRGTIGKIVKENPGGKGETTYVIRTEKRPRLDAVAKFAAKGSVFNETVHSIAAAPAIVETAIDWVQQGPELQRGLGYIAINLGMVAIQRFNRARAIKVMDKSLQRGAEFSPNYTSWTGIDNRAIDNYYTASDQVTHEVETAQPLSPQITQEPPRVEAQQIHTPPAEVQ